MANEIGVRLTGDNASFRSMLTDSVTDAGKAADKITGGVTGKFANLKSVGTALATALGLNLQNIAENAARLFTGMSKDVEEALKRLDAASQKSADLAIANMRTQLSDENKLLLLKQERDRLQQAVTAGVKAEADTVKLVLDQNFKVIEVRQKVVVTEQALAEMKEKELALNEKLKEIADIESKLKEKSLATSKAQTAETERQEEAREKSDAKQRDAQRDELTLETQIAEIKAEILAAETEIYSLEAEGLSTTKELRRIDELRGQLKEAEKKAMSATLEIAKLLLKGEENLTGEERVRLQLLQGITTQKKLDEEISRLTAGLVAGTLNPAERERLAVLVGQSAELKKQLADVTNMNKEVKEFVLTISRKGVGYQDQSTTALSGIQSRLKSQLDQVRAENAQAPLGNRNPFEWSIANELQNVTRELDTRKAIGDYASRFGEDAARFKYGDALTDRALRDLQDSNTRIANTLSSIEQRLGNSPLFPRP